MAYQTKAPEGHWSENWTTDEAAECLSYGGMSTQEGIEICRLLWNDIGPGESLADHWGELTEAQQVKLDAAYEAEYR